MYPQDQVDVVQNAMECEQSQNPPSQKVMPTSRIITRILSTRCKEAFLKQAPRATTSPGFVLDMSTNNWTDAFGGVQAAQEASEITSGVGGYQNRLREFRAEAQMTAISLAVKMQTSVIVPSQRKERSSSQRTALRSSLEEHHRIQTNCWQCGVCLWLCGSDVFFYKKKGNWRITVRKA